MIIDKNQYVENEFKICETKMVRQFASNVLKYNPISRGNIGSCGIESYLMRCRGLGNTKDGTHEAISTLSETIKVLHDALKYIAEDK